MTHNMLGLPKGGWCATLCFEPRNRRGAMMVLIAAALVGLMGMLVLSIDVGFAYRQRRMAQTAADAGAQAGAIEIFRSKKDSAVAAAYSETARNGFTDGVNNVDVTVSYPPVTGLHVGDSSYIEVVVQQTLNTFFGSVLKRATLSIQPRSVAGVVRPPSGCVYALDPSMNAALEVKNNGAQLIADNCDVMVNSNSPSAIAVTSAGVLSSSSISVTGGTLVNSAGVMTPNPATTGVAPSPDPLAGVVKPNMTGPCNFTNITVNDNQVLQPGTYCGGIDINDTGVTMMPGLYIMQGGGFDVQSGASVTGTGVTVVTTNGPGYNPNNFGIVFIHSAATVIMSAMTTGDLANILFYQDPTAGQAGHYYENHIHSSSTSTFTGTLYFPTQGLELGGSAATVTITGGVIAKNITVKSAGSVHISGSVGGTGGGTGVERASIVE